MGLEVRYVTIFSVIKGTLYHEPPFSTILLKNQGILTVKNGSVMTIACCNPHLELRAVALFFHVERGSVVQMSILARLATLCNPALLPVCLGALSINISFDTTMSQFILSNVMKASGLDLMGII